MSNAIFVTGATGNVGSPLTQRLAERGESVRAATRNPEAYEPREHVEAVRFDMADPGTHAPALGEAERVFMMAPPDTGAYPQLVPFVEAAQAAGVRHVVLMTAMGVDQAPDDAPLRRTERHLQRSGMEYTILRPNWFMQNFASYWRGMIQDDGVLRLPAEDAKTSFIHTDDIAAVAAAALTEAGHAGQAYTLTGPEALTYHDAAEVLANAAGRTIRYEPTDDEAFRQTLLRLGFSEEYAGLLIGLFQSVKAGHAAPITPAVRDVAGRPPHTLKAYARAHAEVWR